jgi:hypothetical protein
MNSDNFKQELAELLQTAQPSPALRMMGREALQSKIASRQQRQVSLRRRWVAASVMAAMTLFALGFVPFPAGSAKGALSRAMAAMQQAMALHKTSHGKDAQGQRWSSESWISEDGSFTRCDSRHADGSLASTYIFSGAESTSYNADEKKGEIEFRPNNQYRSEALTGDVAPTRLGLQELIAKTQDNSKAKVTISEKKERSLWGGEINVVVVTVKIDEGSPNIPFTVKTTYEIDSTTNRYISETTESTQQNKSLGYSHSEYEWGTEMPEELREFNFPAGTTVTRWNWWRSRIGKVLAQGANNDWDYTIHALDVTEAGGICVSLHGERRNIDNRQPYKYLWPYYWLEATDDAGNKYGPVYYSYGPHAQGFTVSFDEPMLPPGNRQGHPHELTLTLHSRSPGDPQDEAVVFENLPLPAPAPITRGEVEVIR